MLAAEPHSLSLQEIAKRLDRTPNELFRMLDVLVRRGYLSRLPDSTYVLTLRLFELAQRHPPVERLLERGACPHGGSWRGRPDSRITSACTTMRGWWCWLGRSRPSR